MSNELKFASTEEAMQHLSNVTGKRIKIANADPIKFMEEIDMLKRMFEGSMNRFKESIESAKNELESTKKQYIESHADDPKTTALIIKKHLTKPLQALIGTSELTLKHIEDLNK
jgi:hypothetical protein